MKKALLLVLFSSVLGAELETPIQCEISKKQQKDLLELEGVCTNRDDEVHDVTLVLWVKRWSKGNVSQTLQSATKKLMPSESFSSGRVFLRLEEGTRFELTLKALEGEKVLVEKNEVIDGL